MATLSLDFTTQLNIAYLIRYLILAAIVIFIDMLGQLSASLTCIVSVILNQRAFAHQAAARAPRGRAQTTPSMLPLNRLLPRRPKNALDKRQWSPGAEVELGRVDVELHQDSY